MELIVDISPSSSFAGGLLGFIRYVLSAIGTRNADKSLELEFSAVISANSRLIDKICFFYSSDPQEYEDLRQDIHINIWRGLVNFRDESRKSTWIYRICMNTCVSSWRKNGRHKGALPIDSIAEPSDEESNPNESLEQLHYLISMLNPAEKSLLMMWLDERSYDEIAEVTGFNRNTVATKLRRIKEKLAAIADSKHWNL